MRILSVAAVAFVTVTFCQGQDKVPMQVRSARTRYDAAVKAVVDPIRVRYLEELNRMRSDAMNQKNLDLANAIDAEITAISAEAVRTTDGLASRLTGTTWSWGKSLATPTSTLRFLERGTFRINADPAGTYSLVDGSTIKLDNGATLKFARDLKSYEGTTPSGETRAGVKK